MPMVKERSDLPSQAASIANGRYAELDKDENEPFNMAEVLFQALTYIEDLEARVNALENP